MSWKIGIDLGGTKIEGLYLNHNNEEISRKRIPTEQDLGYKSILSKINGLINDLYADREDVTIGICTPGSISQETGLLKNSNTQCLNGIPFKADLETVVGCEIRMENDANCFALAEALLGAGKSHKVVFGVIMGTGVGGGIIINGKVWHGRNHIAGEWGHNILRSGGPVCYCGKRGCVETFLSGPAMEKQWTELTSEHLSLDQIGVNRLDHPSFNEWKTNVINNFADALSQVINVLDPDVLVIGGGVSNISWLYTSAAEEVRKRVFSDCCDTPIVQNQLGDSAGVFGAALL